MEKYEIKWKNLDTHNEPLSVLNYKKSKRKEELNELEEKVNQLEKQYTTLDTKSSILENTQNVLSDETLWSLPEPSKFTLASTYKNTIVQPKFSKLRAFIQPLINEVFKQLHELVKLKSELFQLRNENQNLKNSILDLSYENRNLKNDLNKIKRFFGKEQIEDILTNKIVKSKRKEHLK